MIATFISSYFSSHRIFVRKASCIWLSIATTHLIIIDQNDNPNNIYMKMSTAFFIRYGLGFTYHEFNEIMYRV